MNKFFFSVIAILFATRLYAQAEPANYANAALEFKIFYNTNHIDSIFNRFSPELKQLLPQDKFVPTTTQLKKEIGELQQTEFVSIDKGVAIYKAAFEKAVVMLNIGLDKNGEYTGLQLTPYKKSQSVAKNSSAADPDITESPINLKTLTSTISGTLAVPKNVQGKVPVVLIIAAAGPVDRDGNGGNLHANDYKLLASALGKSGIASLRFDKRRVGESTATGKEEDLRIDDYSDDVYSLLDLLNNDKRFSKIIILGHGQGALIGSLTAVDERVKALITVEGEANRGDKVVTEDVNRTYPAYIASNFKTVLDSLRRGRKAPKVDPGLYAVARPSLQLYLMSWFRYDPVDQIKQVKVPILVVQGTTDLEVETATAERLKKSKITQIAYIHGMNYALKEAPADKDKNLATYKDPNLPLKPEFVTAVVDFINGLH